MFGAASLTDVLGEICAAFTRDTGITVKTSFAASSALARQIESGARADVFFPADLEWMDYLAERKLIRTATRKEVVANRLVLIAPADSKVAVRSSPASRWPRRSLAAASRPAIRIPCRSANTRSRR